jgi:hypothetical protein
MTDIRRTATTVAGDTVIVTDDSRGDMAGTPTTHATASSSPSVAA